LDTTQHSVKSYAGQPQSARNRERLILDICFSSFVKTSNQNYVEIQQVFF